MGQLTFRKEEKLRKEKSIQELFDKGSSFYLFPFKVYLMQNTDEQYPVHQVLVSVSKKNFKRAVDRNLIKRRMRESYRLQKHHLRAHPPLVFGFIYSHKEILPQTEVMKKMLQAFNKISTISFGTAGSDAIQERKKPL
ncbi:MAG TPA: ribonuclease P protein component [Ohtaekwangia sp.]|nr:ribonuclease P protein component [Ohtaekwangia sp.]